MFTMPYGAVKYTGIWEVNGVKWVTGLQGMWVSRVDEEPRSRGAAQEIERVSRNTRTRGAGREGSRSPAGGVAFRMSQGQERRDERNESKCLSTFHGWAHSRHKRIGTEGMKVARAGTRYVPW
jgi:hypothetical protein